MEGVKKWFLNFYGKLNFYSGLCMILALFLYIYRSNHAVEYKILYTSLTIVAYGFFITNIDSLFRSNLYKILYESESDTHELGRSYNYHQFRESRSNRYVYAGREIDSVIESMESYVGCALGVIDFASIVLYKDLIVIRAIFVVFIIISSRNSEA